MANENETIEDIVGDIRAQNQGLPEDATALSPLVCDILNLADRLEAAHKREVDALNEQIADLRQQRDLWSKRSAELVEKCNEHYAKLKQVGDVAKLRDALVQVQGCADGALMAISHENVPIQHMWDIIDVCKAALSITNQDTQEDNQ